MKFHSSKIAVVGGLGALCVNAAAAAAGSKAGVRHADPISAQSQQRTKGQKRSARRKAAREERKVTKAQELDAIVDGIEGIEDVVFEDCQDFDHESHDGVLMQAQMQKVEEAEEELTVAVTAAADKAERREEVPENDADKYKDEKMSYWLLANLKMGRYEAAARSMLADKLKEDKQNHAKFLKKLPDQKTELVNALAESKLEPEQQQQPKPEDLLKHMFAGMPERVVDKLKVVMEKMAQMDDKTPEQRKKEAIEQLEQQLKIVNSTIAMEAGGQRAVDHYYGQQATIVAAQFRRRNGGKLQALTVAMIPIMFNIQAGKLPIYAGYYAAQFTTWSTEAREDNKRVYEQSVKELVESYEPKFEKVMKSHGVPVEELKIAILDL